MPFSDITLYNDILESHKKGDWENVLKIHNKLDESYFLWPKPSKNDLDFIAQAVRSLKLKKIISLGCGTGLLEWLLTAATGINVVGIEVDKKYWTSKYVKGLFINLMFPQDDNFLSTISDKNAALMFCYFNYRDAFFKYLEIYSGNCIIIIGPHNNGRHTVPSPFDENIPVNWALWMFQKIDGTEDFIAIYTKTMWN